MVNKIYTGKWKGGHIQGIAIDNERKYIYCSFTTEFVKLDMQGNAVGSVNGFRGHLGCLAYNKENGKVYGSLECKDDRIGKGLITYKEGENLPNTFYMAVFDVEKICRMDMDAEKDGIVSLVLLKDPIEDYEQEGHRYGCSGIDGITFAPSFEEDETGSKEMRLLVAYGIYGDNSRDDNDCQVLLLYRIESLMANNAVRFDHRYFVFTGNTTYGVQNMEYDEFTGDIFMAVYPGNKEKYPKTKEMKKDTGQIFAFIAIQKRQIICLKKY